MTDSPASIAQAFVRAINRHDLDALAELMTEQHSFIDSMGNVARGREQMQAGWAAYFMMCPDYSIAVEETYGDGPAVVMLGVAEGTYTPDGKLKPENRWKTPLSKTARSPSGASTPTTSRSASACASAAKGTAYKRGRTPLKLSASISKMSAKPAHK